MIHEYPYSNFNEYNLDWIIRKMKELIIEWAKTKEDLSGITESFDELKEFINSYFNDLDIQDEINNKLEEMAADGTLGNLILPYIAESVSPSRELIIARYGRLLDEYVKENRQSVIRGQAVAFFEGQYYTVGDTAHTTQILSVWSAEGQLMTYKNYTELYHANGLAVDNDHIYIACQDPDVTMAVLSRSSLDIENLITFPELSNLYSVTTYNDKIYFVTTFVENGIRKTKLHLFDPESQAAEELTVFNTPGAVPQNFIIHNEKVYFLYVQSNTIYKFDIKGGNQEYLYYIPDGDGLYPTGECEDLYIKDNDICLAAIPYSDRPITSGESTASILQFFNTNILNPLNKTQVTSYMNGLTPVEFTADGNAAYLFNPGTTVTTLEELSVLASYHKNARLAFQNITLGQLYLKNGNYSLIGANGDRVIDSLAVEQCILNISVTTAIKKARFNYSEVKALNCVFSDLIDINRTWLEMDGCYINNVTIFNILRSDVLIKNMVGSINSSLASAITPQNNVIRFIGNYISGLLRLLVCATGTTGGTTYDILIRVDKSNNNSFNDTLTRSQLVTGLSAAGVNHSINNNASYSAIRFKNGNIYQVDSSSVESEIANTNLIEAYVKR